MTLSPFRSVKCRGLSEGFKGSAVRDDGDGILRGYTVTKIIVAIVTSVTRYYYPVIILFVCRCACEYFHNLCCIHQATCQRLYSNAL